MNIKQIQAKYREWINKNSALTTILAVVFLVGALVAIVFQLKPRTYNIPEIDAYYYDLENDKLFVARLKDLPPIAVPGTPPGNQPKGARAFVFACHDCADEKDRYIGWIELYTPEAKEKLTTAARGSTPEGGDTNQPAPMAPDVMFMQTMEQGHLIARPDPANKEWKSKGFFEFMSDSGNKIMQESQQRCGEGVIPRNCMPADASAAKK
jgi:hypothetical protein